MAQFVRVSVYVSMCERACVLANVSAYVGVCVCVCGADILIKHTYECRPIVVVVHQMYSTRTVSACLYLLSLHPSTDINKSVRNSPQEPGIYG